MLSAGLPTDFAHCGAPVTATLVRRVDNDSANTVVVVALGIANQGISNHYLAVIYSEQQILVTITVFTHVRRGNGAGRRSAKLFLAGTEIKPAQAEPAAQKDTILAGSYS